ncbi:unnamed protein product [Ascophyllum nodosum]
MDLKATTFTTTSTICVLLGVIALPLDTTAYWTGSSGVALLSTKGRSSSSVISRGVSNSRSGARGGLGGKPAARATWSMTAGTSKRARRTQNAQGNLFVDESCIDCDTCRWMQGDTFFSVDGKSAVARQPETEEEKRGAYRAMFACPTNSIRLETADPAAKAALNDFPYPVAPELFSGIFHTGFHAEESFGCSPWLVQRTGGNVLMDSPRFTASLAGAIEKMGGVSWMVLSHIDDVGDHERWKKRFPEMRRVMHKADVQSQGDTGNVEVQLDSDTADGSIDGFEFWDLAEDLRVLHTPGHSMGSITLLYRPSSSGNDGTEWDGAVAFTGDHVGLSGRTGALTGFSRYGYDLNLQSKSMELLARPDIPFRWILPGHGRKIRFTSDQERMSQIKIAATKVKDRRD